MAVLLGSIRKIGETKKLNYKDFIGREIYVNGRSPFNGWTETEFKKAFEQSLLEEFFEYEFYYNYVDDKKTYSESFIKETLNPMMKNINKTLNKYYELVDDSIFKSKKDLKIKYKYPDLKKIRIKLFLSNKSIPEKMKKEYIEYAKKFYGIIIK
jgi:hypothetical protein